MSVSSPRNTSLPTSPGNLTAAAASTTVITLAWVASTDSISLTGYQVERCQDANCSNFTQIASTSSTSFNDSGLTASTPYSYRVRASDSAGNLSAYSNTATATTLSSSGSPPRQTPAFLNGQRQVNSFLAEGATTTAVTGACSDNPSFLPYHFCLADSSLIGNAIVAACRWDTNAGVAASLMDDKGQNYTPAFGSPPSDGSNTVQIWYVVNSAAGVHELSLNFSGGTPNGIQCGAYQLQNIAIASPNCGTTQASGTGTSVAAGSFTPAADNCFILQLAISDSAPSGTWIAGGSFTLQDVSVREGFALQTSVQQTPTAINPTLTMSSSDGWVTAAIALKSESSGTAAAGIHVQHISQNALVDGKSSYTFQFPCSGNLVVVAFNGNTGESLSSVTGTNPTSTYTQIGSGVVGAEGVQQIWQSPANIACTQNHTITITGSAISVGDVMFYDVAGAATSSPSDSSLATDTGVQSAFGTLNTAVVTPASSEGLLFCTAGIADNGSVSFNPTGYQDNQDENNGWGHFHYISQTAIQTTWGTDRRQASGGVLDYSDACAAFKASTP